MTIHAVILHDRCDNSACFAFSSVDEADSFAEAQRTLGIWYQIDKHCTPLDSGDEMAQASEFAKEMF